MFSERRRIVAGVVVVLTGCGSPGVDPSVQDRPPVRTAIGTPTGPGVTQVIGAAGGSIVSGDGRVSVIIPAGALGSNQSIGIQPISGNSPAHVGAGYRLTPDGITFSRPVQVSFAFSPEYGAANTVVNYGVAFQEPTGAWRWIDEVVRDSVGRTVTASTTHFTDYSLVFGAQLTPATATVKPGQTLDLEVSFCFEVSRNAATSYMLECSTVADLLAQETPPLGGADPASWAVNGLRLGSSVYGRVRGSNESATYTAPARAPLRNVVAVSVDWVSDGKKVATLVANVTIEAVCGGSSITAASPHSVADDCSGNWVGHSLVSLDTYGKNETDVTWVPDSTSTPEAVTYTPRGNVTFTPADVCLQISPSTMAMTATNTRASLLVYFATDSLIYQGQGGTEWTADLVDTCKGGPSHKALVGGAWYTGGGTSRNLRLISASVSTSGLTSTYSFSR